MFISIAHADIIASESHNINAVENASPQVAGVAKASLAHSFPPFDHTYFAAQLFWLAISFGLFYLFISKIIAPNIGRTLETRHDRIASDLDAAVRLKSEADTIVQQYEKDLQAAHVKFGAVVSEAKNAAKTKLAQEMQENEAVNLEQLSIATQNIDDVKKKALQSVDDMVKTLVPSIVKKLINEDISSKHIENLLHKTLRAPQ